MNNTGKRFKRVRVRRTTSPGIILGDGVINSAPPRVAVHGGKMEGGGFIVRIHRNVYAMLLSLRKAKRELLRRNVTLQ